MRAHDHQRITQAALALQTGRVAPSLVHHLLRGCVYPDQIDSRFAHHWGRQADIRRYVLEARRLFLLEKLEDSAFRLGMAFHFIADGTCPGSTDQDNHRRSRRALRKHNDWEEEVSRCYLPKLTINRLADATEIDGQIARVKQEASPNASLLASVEMCSALLDLTWRSPTQKTDDERRVIEEAQRRMPSNGIKLGVWLCVGLVSLAAWAASQESIWPALFSGVLVGTIGNLYIKSRQDGLWILRWYGVTK